MVERTDHECGLTSVIGVDGSPGSKVALRWAENHEEICGRLHPVVAWTLPYWAHSHHTSVASIPPLRELVEHAAKEDMTSVLSGVDPDRLVQPQAVQGRAGEVLVETASHADLLVVGTRGRGAIADHLLGSTSLHCVTHSSVPVLVVPGTARVTGEIGRIVVGVDGSPGGVAALRWAIEHANGATVEAVHAYGAGGPLDPSQLFADAEADALGHPPVGGDGPLVDWVVTPGDPRLILPRRDGDLLVVGMRGRRSIRHLLLGSVASSLVDQPSRPTLLVPAASDGDD